MEVTETMIIIGEFPIEEALFLKGIFLPFYVMIILFCFLLICRHEGGYHRLAAQGADEVVFIIAGCLVWPLILVAFIIACAIIVFGPLSDWVGTVLRFDLLSIFHRKNGATRRVLSPTRNFNQPTSNYPNRNTSYPQSNNRDEDPFFSIGIKR